MPSARGITAFVCLLAIRVGALASILACPGRVSADPGCRQATRYAGGTAGGTLCASDAGSQGLTVLDLSEGWLPLALDEGPDGTAPGYRSSYVALADERFADAERDREAATRDRHLEVYGVIPSLRVLRARLADEARHRCRDAVGDVELASLTATLHAEPTAAARRRVRRTRQLRAALDREARRRGLTGDAELAEVSAYYRKQTRRLARMEHRVAAVRGAQGHLACDGLLGARHVDGAFTWRTSQALAAYQRRHVLAPDGALGPGSAATLVEDSRDLDFRAALRALRERVVGATGLIEDGSAGDGPGLVLGRALDPAILGHVPGHGVLHGAAPDLVSAATEAAARALGWTSPAAVLAFFDAFVGGPVTAVAVEVPAPPPYHSEHMELLAEIDRGDVWYDRRPRHRRIERRPALILYAVAGGERVPLVRWPTTIGGWHDEKLRGGAVVKRWKESDVGRRVWRDLVLAPRWLPPHSTPDDELVRRVDGGRYELRRSLIGPSYRGAFGLAMMIHHEVRGSGDRRRHVDHGIRVHGSGNVPAIFHGTSHGCHRLVGGQALRLAGFLLQHRHHVRHGALETRYRRTVRHHGRHVIAVDRRGYLVELTPPVVVEVLPGRIRSARQEPW